jgi:hypothetical protein
MTDLSYRINGLFARFLPNTKAGEQAWKQMEVQHGATILARDLKVVLHQIKTAGYTVAKEKKCKMTDDELLAALGI